MIGKVIKLSNNLEYCVIDQLDLESKTYIVAFGVNNETEETNNEFVICEVVTNLNGQSLKDIDDKEIYEKVSIAFLKRLENK